VQPNRNSTQGAKHSRQCLCWTKSADNCRGVGYDPCFKFANSRILMGLATNWHKFDRCEETAKRWTISRVVRRNFCVGISSKPLHRSHKQLLCDARKCAIRCVAWPYSG